MSIETILAYHFTNKKLLEEALTHPGCAETRKDLPFNYQRLEFLGDSVLGLVIAEIIYVLYPKESEGKLAKRQAALVRSEALAEVARHLGIADYVKFPFNDKTIMETGGNLEDVLEAIIGAIYLDGGFEAVKQFVTTHWKNMASQMREAPKDAKTALQEWVQSKGQALPKYTVLSMSGPSHAPLFTIEASIETGEAAQAQSNAKRQAEQMAAQALLETLISRQK